MILSKKIDQIFSEDKRILKILPPEIYTWAKSIILKNYENAKDQEGIDKITGKITHIKNVIKAGLDIVNNSMEMNWNIPQAVTICFLHDIGRFQQLAVQSVYKDYLGIDHAALGVELIKNFEFDPKYNLNKKEIIRAVKFHNKKDYKGNNVYCKLIRDADKLGLFRDQKFVWDDINHGEYTGNKLNKPIIEKFLTRKTISNKDIKTAADMILNRTGWFWHLKFEATRQICRKEKLLKPFKEKLSTVDTDPKTLNLIYQKIDKF